MTNHQKPFAVLLLVSIMAGIAAAPAFAQNAKLHLGAHVSQVWSSHQGSILADSLRLTVADASFNRTGVAVYGEYQPHRWLAMRLAVSYTNVGYTLQITNTKTPCPACNLTFATGVFASTIQATPTVVLHWPINQWMSLYGMGGMSLSHNFNIPVVEGVVVDKPHIWGPQVIAAVNASDELPPRWFASYTYGAGVLLWRIYVQAVYSQSLGSRFFSPITIQGQAYEIPSQARNIFFGIGYRHTFLLKGN